MAYGRYRSLTVGESGRATGGARGRSPQGAPAPSKTVATGLNNPRHVSYDHGALYVAESGTGGSGPCITGAEGRACYGASGSITRVSAHGQRRVVTGLPSIAAQGQSGAQATGPSDVLVH